MGFAGVGPLSGSSELSSNTDQLADAFRYQVSGGHFGKVAVE
jgi:hypothetical protein